MIVPTTMLLFLLLCSPMQMTSAFGSSNPTKCIPSVSSAPCPLLMASTDDSSSNTIENDDDNDDDDDNDYDNAPVVGRPISRMTDYAAQFLDKTAAASQAADEGDENTVDDDSEDVAARITAATLEDISEATHLVAIPMESSHELLIELESVQRAILHHCPILLDACISAATTRLPLLYIKAPDANLNENPQNSASVTGALAGTVQRLVKKHIYGTGAKKNVGDKNDDNGSDEDDVLNAEGYRPLTMTFQSLEIDGSNNNILNTVGTFCDVDDDDDTDDTDDDTDDDDDNADDTPNYNEQRFENLIRDLQSAIAAQGWKVAFPPDPNRAENEQSGSTTLFRPRVAFMELPKSFDENISRFKDVDTEIKEEEVKFLRAEEGGNGISPIFWCNWWDDVFERNVRLQEIGIYPTNPVPDDIEDSSLVQNSQFYIPFETIGLPDGNEEMKKSEKKFFDYQEKRIEESEEEFRKENFESESEPPPQLSENPLSSTSSKSSEPDILMKRTRQRLESVYLKDAGIENSDTWIEDLDESQFGDDSTEQDDEDIIDLVETKDITRSTDDDYIEDWMRKKIMEAANKSTNDDEEKSIDTTQDNAKPMDPIENNKDPSTEPTSIKKENGYTDIWMEEKIKKAVNSLGSVQSREVEKKEPKYSIEDNPVFKAYKKGALTDKKKPKAPPTKKLGPYPGNDHFVGIWKVTVNPMGEEGNSNIQEGSENLLLRVDGTTAAGPTLNPETKQKAAGGTWKMLPQENGDILLRIRLVIPPEKNRILVMEGRVNRGSQLGIQMASRTFGIPQLEEKAKEASQSNEDQLLCSGESYIEDAVTKKNKIRAENFYIEKVQGGVDPDKYTITVPKTIRRLD